MKRIILLLSALFLQFVFGKAQNLTDSKLPIVIINTDTDPSTGQPRTVPDEYKTGAVMKIIFHSDSSRNYVSDQNNPAYLNYNGRIGIERRGSSSQSLPKKPYGLTTLKDDKTTNNNVSILGMPAENDWILNSLAFDASLIRNFLSYELSRAMGNYAPRGVYCEVIINGSYQGLYIFMEKIKVDSGRVNISKITPYEINSPEVTGGYIVKTDKTTGGDPVAWTMSSYNGSVDFIYDTPEPYEIRSQQVTYIQSQFTNLKNSVQNSSVSGGFPSVIDVPSFIDFMIMSEISSNADSYKYSTYFHKDRGGKLRAGPIWDYDLTYGNDLFMWGFDRSHYNVWQFNNGDNTGPKFWKDLFDNSTFRCYLTRRWKNLNTSGAPLSYQSLSTRIDSIVNHIAETIPRESSKWGKVGNHPQQITNMKSWLQKRIEWLNSGLTSFQSCASPSTPPLVISKIHYNPKATLGHDSQDLEFIEITNNGNTAVNLTGLYFRELGLSYQFPANSYLPAGENLYISNNAVSFQQYYGINPLGEFSRNLSNKSERLILSDAFGNTIDSVEYQSKAPWPDQASGTGYYLKLTDLNADNSMAASWTVSSGPALGVSFTSGTKEVEIYPNPARSIINIESPKHSIAAYELVSIRGGKIIYKSGLHSKYLAIDISGIHPGMYLIRITLENGDILIQKINKLPE